MIVLIRGVLFFIFFSVVVIFLGGVITAFAISEEISFIPEGEFIMGSDERDGRSGEYGVDEVPRQKVYLKGFFIDTYETANRDYLVFVQATAHKVPDNRTHPDDPFIWKEDLYPPGYRDKPVSLIDWFDARDYCQWKGKRLPTEEEWEKAARGIDGRKYPWGNRYDLFRSNMRALGLTMTVAVTRFPNGKSPYGVYNMIGNVSEWTSSWYDAYPGNTLKRELFGKQYRVVKGGAFTHMADSFGRVAARLPLDPHHSHRSLGIRCAKNEGE